MARGPQNLRRFAKANSIPFRYWYSRDRRRKRNKVKVWTPNAPDNQIVSGASFANWTVDANSFKTATGMILGQTGTSDNLIVDISGLAVATNYWMAITIDRRSPGASTGNVRLVAVADTGNEIAGVAGALVNLHAAGTTGTFYNKVLTHTSFAVAGKCRMVLKHATSPDTQAVACDAATDKITLAAHNLLADMPVRLATGTPPAGLANATTYYVKNPTTNDFQLALTPGGAVIDFTTNGTTVTMCNWFRITNVVLYPIPARSSAKVAILGDRTASYSAAVAGQVDTAILAAAGDNVNVVAPGDLSDGTNAIGATNDALRNALIAKGGNLYASPGNWDYQAAAGIAGWKTYFGLVNTYRSKVLGTMEFFFYDTNIENTDNNTAGGVAGAQLDIMGKWLLAALAASTATWKIVVAHHPAFTSSSHHGGPSNNGTYAASLTCMQWDWKSLGVALVIQSHDHVVERMLVNGTFYQTFALGGGAANAFGTPIPESQYRSTTAGYLKIHDSTTKLVIEHFDINNLLLDRVAISVP
jgi:hypothetical protein